MANVTVKVTKKDRFAEIRGIVAELGRTDLVEFVDHEVELLNKKATNKSSKPSAKQIENANLSATIYDAILGLEPMTVTDIIKTVPELAGLSTQRVRPMLADTKRFSNSTVKGKSLYKAI